MKATFKVNEFTHEDLVNFFSDSIYGSDWLGVTTMTEYGAVLPKNLDEIKEEFERNNGTYCREDEWADILLNGGTIVFVDNYDEDENGEEGKCYPITLKDVKKGFSKSYNECRENLMNFLTENGDYYDANNIAQVIMFGEVVYG